MSTDQTTNIGLPLMMPAQAQKHVTVNEALVRLDALVQAVVESRTQVAQPGAPGDGTLWICPPGKTGADWGGFADWALGYHRDGVWEAMSARAGWRVWVKDEGVAALFDGVEWKADSAIESVNGGPVSGLRNVVMNGAFDIWQRGDSVTGSDLFGPDRWLMNSSGATQTLERRSFGTSAEAGPMGWPANYLRMSMSAADNYAGVMHRVEDVRTLAGGPATVSFWARHAGSPPSGPVRVSLFQNFGLGGSSQALQTRDIWLTSGWVHYGHIEGLVFDLSDLEGKSLGDGHSLRFMISNVESEIWNLDIACVQIERGCVATKFERRPPALEMGLCRRYFRRYQTQQDRNDLAFEMRTLPAESGAGPYDYSAEL